MIDKIRWAFISIFLISFFPSLESVYGVGSCTPENYDKGRKKCNDASINLNSRPCSNFQNLSGKKRERATTVEDREWYITKSTE